MNALSKAVKNKEKFLFLILARNRTLQKRSKISKFGRKITNSKRVQINQYSLFPYFFP